MMKLTPFAVLTAPFLFLAGQFLGAAPGPRPVVIHNERLQDKNTIDAVELIALELSNHDTLAARRRAAAFVEKAGYDAPKLRLGEHHRLFTYSSKGGFGVGGKEIGIEAHLRKLVVFKGRFANQLVAETEDLKQLAYRTAAIAEITLAATPPRLQWRKPPWELLCWEMKDEALKLAAAVKKQNTEEVQRAAKALDATCTACHQQLVLRGAPLFQPAQ